MCENNENNENMKRADDHIFSFLFLSGVTLPLPTTLVGQRCHWRRYNQYHRHPSPFLIRLFPQPKMFKLQTPSKLSCFYANALSPPPAIIFRKIWNQSILIIFVLSHIWYSSKCSTIYCEKDIVIYWEFVEDGFTTSSGPSKMTNFYFSWWK